MHFFNIGFIFLTPSNVRILLFAMFYTLFVLFAACEFLLFAAQERLSVMIHRAPL